MGYVRYVVSLSGVYAVDETKVLSVKGEYYYLWIVRDVKTRAVPFFMVRSARSGVHVLVILAAMRGMEELAGKYFKRVDEVVYLHDGASIYNAFTWLNVNHKRVTFGKRDYAEQGLGVLNIGFHQWTNTSLGTLTQRRSRGGSQPISLSITSFTARYIC